jgi:hypothetical protein
VVGGHLEPDLVRLDRQRQLTSTDPDLGTPEVSAADLEEILECAGMATKRGSGHEN